MKFKPIEILLNILFWGLMIWIFVFGNGSMDVVSSEIINGKEHKILARNIDKLYAILIAQFFFALFFYGELYLIHKLRKPRAVKGFILKTIGLIFGTLLVYVLSIKTIFFSNNETVLKDINIVFMNIFYIAVTFCYGFIKKWIRHERDRKKLELVKNQAELNLLKQQLQPHFLFNTMNNLMAMVNQSENPKLAKGIDKLSGLLRFVVYDTQASQKVTISREIQFIRNFAELHLLRFEDGEIDFKIEIKGTFKSQPIEPGLFLCYVENAFKHGVQPEEKAFIYIDIDISKEDTIVFNIENSIPKVPFENESGGFGLKSNQERLDLAYPNKHSINFENDSTYRVELTIYTDD